MGRHTAPYGREDAAELRVAPATQARGLSRAGHRHPRARLPAGRVGNGRPGGRVVGRRGQERRRRGAHATAIARFDAALALWRGPAIAEFADRDFARTEAARLDELRASVAEDRVDAVLAAGRHHEAVADCERLVAAEPLRERRWTQLMLALYRDGRQGEALAAYRRLRDLLAEQLGVDPGPQEIGRAHV